MFKAVVFNLFELRQNSKAQHYLEILTANKTLFPILMAELMISHSKLVLPSTEVEKHWFTLARE